MNVPTLRFLSQLDAHHIAYVSWKNNQEVSLALGGGSDLDIFVPRSHEAGFRRIAAVEGWLEAENPVASFPGVTHYFAPGRAGRMGHVHVYFDVITGESWTKEFSLPLGNWLMANRIRHEDSGIWVLDRGAQAYLFVVRHLLKNASFLSRALYRRELVSYRAEWTRCAVDPASLAGCGPVDVAAYLAEAGVTAKGVELPSRRVARRFRRDMAPYRRISPIRAALKRWKGLVMRLAGRSGLERRKRVVPSGFVVAVCGAEGSGKSTLAEYVRDVLGGTFSVAAMHMGKPFGRVIGALVSVRSQSRRLHGTHGTPSPATPGSGSRDRRRPGAAGCVAALVLGALRLRAARRCRKLADDGWVVVTDRYPTAQVGRMDGPRLDPGAVNGVARRFVARLENSMYERMPAADACIYLDVPVELAVRRNQERAKADKESDAEVVQRHEANRNHTVKARRIVRHENVGVLEEAREVIIEMVWSELVRRADTAPTSRNAAPVRAR